MEQDLVEDFELYLERYRNLDFLEHEVDTFDKVRPA